MRLGIVPLTVISIALIPAYCKGGEVSKAKGRKVVSIRAVMLEFEKVAVEMPQNVDVLGNQGPSWGFSPEHKALERRIRLGNETRSLVVVFDSSTTTPKAIGAIVRIEKPGETAQDRRFRDFKVNREGTLERVIDSTGKYDEQGEPITGSGVGTDSEVAITPEVAAEFEHQARAELEWLSKRRAKAKASSTKQKPKK